MNEIIGEVGNELLPTPGIHPAGGEILVKRSEQESTDINVIVARHVAAGVPIFPDGRARYGDFSSVDDYHSALDAVMEAQQEFEMLPADIRDLCKNDPGEFLRLCSTDEGLEKLLAAGLDDSAVPDQLVKEAPVGEPPAASEKAEPAK